MKIKRGIRRRLSRLLRRPINQRRFVDSSLGASGFLKILKEEDVDYVVLRWFETLPHVAPGEDIDILVADNDIEIMTSYMKSVGNKGDIPCDVYSVSGLPGSNSRNMPYYPVPIARKILDNAIWVNHLVKAPSHDDHFLSLCYHVLYHKGYSSGVPSEDAERNKKVLPCNDHDYVAMLERLYQESSLKSAQFVVTLEGIDRILSEAGWKPAHDTLEKISMRNQWIRDALCEDAVEIPDDLRGLSIFLVREEGMEYLDVIKKILFDQGFDHVMEGSIPEERVGRVASGIRGGNWGKGPWPKSGGLPSYYYVVYDAKPISPNKKMLKDHPGLHNERISMAKLNIRDKYNREVGPKFRCNILHSADNADQTLYYLGLINTGCIPFVKEEACRKYSAFATPFAVVKDLSKHARRAKVELIDFHGKKAICKTFKEGREHFLEREITARKVGAGLSEVSSLLKAGKNYIVMEFCEGSRDEISSIRPFFHSHDYLPIWAIEQMKQIIIYYRARGYECVDFSPRNVLIDSSKGLKVIDFEFLQKVDAQSAGLVGNLAWYSPPDGFEGDLPQGKTNVSLYRRRWFRYTGLPIYFCLNDFPKAVLHLVRGVTFIYFSVNNARRKAVSLPFKKFNFR
ncbi:MAG: hypothetical protein IBX53_03745 [Halomonas sp.]|uniref:hypothetical protein n=1 Tax=Halomonas sp. TaxID=1486246 RepID=UPI0019F2C1B7|nr:hypothetical protein [Halomonas sp.]MBE0488170.1 hypothetical protein [Halomonas sp.]